MRILLVLSFIVTSVWGCGVSSYPPVLNRVVGGADVRPHSWPWQVSLQSGKFGHWNHACGGTLLSSDWVMTAAHCFLSGYSYRVQLGKHSLENSDEKGSLTLGLSRIVKHPAYNSHLTRNDIALLKLENPVSFSDTIRPACLPQEGAVLPHGAPCYVTGWGRLATEGPGAVTLQQALLPVVSFEVCSQDDWWSFLLTRNMVCAGDGVRSSCMGDSGGPLNCQSSDGSWAVHGVVSFGSSECNAVQKPSVFTRVSAYNQWISSTMTKY